MESTIISLHTFRRTLGFGRDYAYRLARSGKIKAFKGGRGAWVLPISELHDFPVREASRVSS